MINIAVVSGAAGMISNHLLFKLASRSVLGPNQPIALKLLGSERSIQALEGVAMEPEDSLFPLLREAWFKKALAFGAMALGEVWRWLHRLSTSRRGDLHKASAFYAFLLNLSLLKQRLN
ncbi:hypothetical protein Bca101_033957 [Brassica carinata]